MAENAADYNVLWDHVGWVSIGNTFSREVLISWRHEVHRNVLVIEHGRTATRKFEESSTYQFRLKVGDEYTDI